MQTITIVRYHLTSDRMTFINEKIIHWQGCGEGKTLGTLLVEIQIDTAIRKNSMEVLLKFKIKLPYDLDIPLLWGSYRKELKLESQSNTWHSHVNCGTIHNTKDMKTT